MPARFSEPDLDSSTKPENWSGLQAQNQPDSVLVAMALADDQDAFHVLVNRYLGPVTAVSYGMLGERESARDIAQETFAEGYRMLLSLRDPAKFGGWVCGIARRKSIYLLRRRKRSPLVQMDLRADQTEVSGLSPPEHLERKEMRQQVLRALHQLSEKYRVVLVLKYDEGMSYEKIATLLDVSVATVDKRLTRAKAMLRKMLKDI